MRLAQSFHRPLSDRPSLSLSLPLSSSLVVSSASLRVFFVACGSSFVSLCQCPIFLSPLTVLAEFSDSVFFPSPLHGPRREKRMFFFRCLLPPHFIARPTQVRCFLKSRRPREDAIGTIFHARRKTDIAKRQLGRLAWKARPHCGHRPCP